MRDAQRGSVVDGQSWAAGVQAANDAAENYERTAKRPTFNGTPSLALEYIREPANGATSALVYIEEVPV